MGRIEKTVFISYRRTNFYTALAVYQDLTAHGYDVFFDYQSIDSGNFAKAILENIKARAHFVLVLSSSALERCSQPNDWLRREIETAMELKRNIVPLMMEGFDFGSPSTVQALSGKLATLNTYNGLCLYSEYFFDGMEKLRTRFLKVAIDDLRSHEVSLETREISTETKEANEVKKLLADEAEPVELHQLSAEAWFERAYVFEEGKNYDEAIRCYKKAIELEPDLDAAHNNLGILLRSTNRLNEAEIAYRKAIEINPFFTETYSNLGILLSDLNRINEAETAYHKAIEINPFFIEAYSNLGLLLQDLKRTDEAEAAFRKAIEISPFFAEAYYNLGVLLSDLNRTDEAEFAYHKAVEINPSYYTAYYNLGILLTDLNRIDEAITAYRKAIEINPDLPESYYNLACLFSSLNNKSLAFEQLEIAVQKGIALSWAWDDPDLQWIQNDPRFVQIVGPKPEL